MDKLFRFCVLKQSSLYNKIYVKQAANYKTYTFR